MAVKCSEIVAVALKDPHEMGKLGIRVVELNVLEVRRKQGKE